MGPGTLLYAGDLLESPGEGGAEVRLASGARLVLWPGTRVKLGLPRPGDLGLATGGVAVVDAAPDGSAAGA